MLHRIAAFAVALVYVASPSCVLAGAATPALSYCAHWFSRDGKACLSTATAGQLVSVNAFDATDLGIAGAHCARAGCKINLYCECASTADVQKVAAVYAHMVTQYGQVFLPQVEVDGIRDIPVSSRTEVARALSANGFSLILKNMPNASEFGTIVPVSRVVYEDLVNNTQYAQEFAQLAAQQPALLLTGIVHQGGYDGDAGASSAQAMATFDKLKGLNNVELFYGTPASFSQAKSFGSQMLAAAREVGQLTSGLGAVSGGSPVPSGATAPTPIQSSPAQSYLAPQQMSAPPAAPIPATAQPLQYFAPQTSIPPSVSGGTVPSSPIATTLTNAPATSLGSLSATPRAVPVSLPQISVPKGEIARVAIAEIHPIAATTVAALPSSAPNTFTSPNLAPQPPARATGILALLDRIISTLRSLLSLLGG